MVIFQYNLYIFGIHLWTMLYPKLYYKEQCYKEVVVYLLWRALSYLEPCFSTEVYMGRVKQKRAKFAYSDHSIHGESIVRAFAFYSYIL